MVHIDRQLEEWRKNTGVEFVTDWLCLDQRAVDVFAAVTEDFAPHHNDPGWAQKTGRWGGRTIVHGMYEAALIPRLLKAVPNSVVYASDEFDLQNYGLDSLRWTSRMYVGVPIRGRVTLKGLEFKTEERCLLTYSIAIEQQGSDKPCMVAESLLMVIRRPERRR